MVKAIKLYFKSSILFSILNDEYEFVGEFLGSRFSQPYLIGFTKGLL